MAMNHGQKILVIDDDPDMVEVMRVVLESRGYRVSSAASAPEGMARAEQERPDLILLDVMMPTGTEGFHFVWSLRNHRDPSLRNVPIIVVSALHRTTDLRFYPQAADTTYAPGEFLPVQDFVDKPIDPTDLVRRVERVLKAKDRS